MGGQGRRAWPLSFARALVACLSVSCAAPARADSLDLRADPGFESAAEALEPVNWVMTQAAATSRNALMRLIFQDSAEAGRLQVAPLRWRGNLGFEQRLTTSGDGTQRAQSIELAGLELATFIGQPWLAQVRASLGVVAQQERAQGGPLESHAGRARAANLTGGGHLALFPTSRFPFTATFEQSDSRASGEATASDYVSRMLALRQAYRTPLGDQVYTASLESSTLISGSFGRDSVTAFNASMQRRFDVQTLDVAGAFSRNRRSTAEGFDLARFSARHSYRPTELFGVESFASFSGNDASAGGADFSSRFAQLNSFGSWRPDEESPWYVVGGVRLSDASLGGSGEAGSARSIGANLALSYALGEHAHVTASASLASVTAGTVEHFVTTQSAAATYAPPPVALGGFGYSWTAGAALGNGTGGPEGSRQFVSVQAGQQLSRGLALGPSASLSGNVNQAATVSRDTGRALTTTLTHSAALALRVDPGPSSSAFASISAGESRSQGERDDRFRLLNLQLSGQLQLGAHSVVAANFTAQASRQHREGQEGSPTQAMRSGTIAYHHNRLFGVPRLRLQVSATFNDLQLESRLLGDAAAPRDQYSRLYEAQLLYAIGRLDLRLGTRLAELDGKEDRQFFFRVNRQFGLY